MENLYLILFLGSFVVFGLIETVRPGRAFPTIKRWRIKGVAFLGIYFALASFSPLLWDAWLAERTLFDLTAMPLAVSATLVFLVLELGIYLWHRMLHASDFLFRVSHQMHHSAERVDVFGAYYFHPLDMIGFTFVGSLVLVGLLGVQVEAAILANMGATFFATFQHSNLKTPHWLGYLIQRPENHALHHQRGLHAYNYGDIAIWDMLFGTWKNPKRWEEKAGYYDGASTRVIEMLIGKDVTEPKPETNSEDRSLPEAHAA